MTPLQERKYWRVWADLVKALRTLRHCSTADELRHWTHAQALGRDKSHKTFNNLDFDAWLRFAMGYIRMADLDEQLRLQAMPATRAVIVCEPVLDAAGVEANGRLAYVRAVYTRIQAKRPARGEAVYALEEIPDVDIALVYAALLHTAQHKQGVEHLHSRTGKGRVRYAHDVGARKRDREADAVAPIDQEPERAEPVTPVRRDMPGATGFVLVAATSAEPQYRGPVHDGDPF